MTTYQSFSQLPSSVWGAEIEQEEAKQRACAIIKPRRHKHKTGRSHYERLLVEQLRLRRSQFKSKSVCIPPPSKRDRGGKRAWGLAPRKYVSQLTGRIK